MKSEAMRATLDLDPSWEGRRVFVNFQGVETAFYVWINGSFVGYSEDSFTPSEFEVTSYLKAGRNRLCVEVVSREAARAGWRSRISGASPAFSAVYISMPRRKCM